jgi:hypothetical protein
MDRTDVVIYVFMHLFINLFMVCLMLLPVVRNLLWRKKNASIQFFLETYQKKNFLKYTAIIK